jgi:hypothetical protein
VNWGQCCGRWSRITYVTTLEHEVGDDSVESRASVTEAVLAGTELTEVTSSLGDNVVVELEGDSASRGVYDQERSVVRQTITHC